MRSTELRPRFQCRMQIVTGLERGEQSLQIADCRLHTPALRGEFCSPSDCRLQITDRRFQMENSNCPRKWVRMQIADFRVEPERRSTNCQQIAECRFQDMGKSLTCKIDTRMQISDFSEICLGEVRILVQTAECNGADWRLQTAISITQQ